MLCSFSFARLGAGSIAGNVLHVETQSLVLSDMINRQSELRQLINRCMGTN